MSQKTMLSTIAAVALGIAGAVSSAQAGDKQSVAAARRVPMRNFVFAAAAVATLVATVPAPAQVFFSNDPAAGDGSDAAAIPAYGANQARGFDFDYATACRLLRERPVVTRGVKDVKNHRSC